jgi:NADH-quinone oxidoreductase subunit N
MFLRKSDEAIPYFKNKLSMKIGLAMAVIGVLFIGLYSPIYAYIYELSLF